MNNDKVTSAMMMRSSPSSSSSSGVIGPATRALERCNLVRENTTATTTESAAIVASSSNNNNDFERILHERLTEALLSSSIMQQLDSCSPSSTPNEPFPVIAWKFDEGGESIQRISDATTNTAASSPLHYRMKQKLSPFGHKKRAKGLYRSLSFTKDVSSLEKECDDDDNNNNNNNNNSILTSKIEPIRNNMDEILGTTFLVKKSCSFPPPM